MLSLTAGTGSITFSGPVGITQLSDLTINSASGGVTANSSINATEVSITNGGAVDLNGAVTVDNGLSSTGATFDNTNGSITVTSGDITINHTGAVTIGASMTTGDGDMDLDSGAAFSISSGALVDAGSKLIDIEAAGDITLGGGVKTTSASASAVQITSTGGSIIDGGDDPALDVDAANGTLTMTAAGSIGSGNPLEIKVATLNAQGSSIDVAETDDLVLGVVDAGSGSVSLLAGGNINDGTIKGGTVTIEAQTIGLTQNVTVDVGPDNLFATLHSQVGSVSGIINPGAALTGTPTRANISAPGAFVVGQTGSLLNTQQEQIAQSIGTLAVLAVQQEALEVLLRAAAKANFFMIPPLDLFIDMEEEEEFLEGAWLLNPGNLNVRSWIDGPTLLPNPNWIQISPELSLFPNWNQEQQPRLLASL